MYSRKHCDPKCPRYNEALAHPCIPGRGPRDADVVFVGRDPGQEEIKQGKCFIGPSGKLLKNLLRGSGLEDRVYITNAVKCGLAGEDKEPSKPLLRHCRKYLVKEIKIVKPRLIIASGNAALETVLGKTGIMKLQNQTIYSSEFDCNVIPVVHPAYVLRNPSAIGLLRSGFSSAVNELNKKKEKTKYLVAKNAKQASAFLRQLAQQDAFAFDVETTGKNYLTSNILCVQFTWKFKTGVTIPWELIEDSETNTKLLKHALEGPAVKVAQNLKFDIQFLWKYGFEVKGPHFDTMLAHSLLDDNAFEHNLNSLVLKYLPMGAYWSKLDRFKEEYCKEHGIKDTEFSYDLIPPKVLYEYGAGDTDATYRLFRLFADLLKEEKQHKFFYRYTMPFTPVLAEMEYRGIKVKRDKIKVMINDCEKEIEDLTALIKKDPLTKRYETWKTKHTWKTKTLTAWKKSWTEGKTTQARFPEFKDYVAHRKSTGKKLVKHEFNASSSTQLKELFFEMLKLEPIKMTKNKSNPQPAADKQVMAILADDYDIELAGLLAKRNKVTKFVSAFLKPTYEKSAIDGRIHTTYVQSDVKTGRLSSRDPNMQNLPKDQKAFRRCFVADKGFHIVKADLGQAEFRVWASASGDKQMIRDIEKGLDIHRKTAAAVFGAKELEDVTKEQRQSAKAAVFGMMYGIGLKKLCKDQKITEKQGKALLETFGKNYPQAMAYIEGLVAHAHKHHYCLSWMGRKRRLPNINSKDDEGKSERQARNSPIQAAASDMNNAYMVAILNHARREGIEVYPAMTTHDENALQVKKGSVGKVIEIMEYELNNLFKGKFHCPMVFDYKVGRSIQGREVESLEKKTCSRCGKKSFRAGNRCVECWFDESKEKD